MTKTIKRKICDVCKKEVNDFVGSLELKYQNSDYGGCGYLRRISYPVKISYRNICVDCCRKLDKVIRGVKE